ncbi:MAG: thermonuclease family protein [bacterium]|nr:thermonuclease family protein [bacterium]
MRRLWVILGLGILLLSSKPAIASSLSDFINLDVGSQTVGTVTSVIDGDTIWIELMGTQTRVRLLSIDTPELPSDPYAQEAASFTAQALLNKPIQLFYNPKQQWDKYHRLLAVVVKDREIFNIKLLEQGLAVRMFINNALIKFPAWEDVEIQARQQRLNIWSKINSIGIFINEINPNPHPESDDEAEFVELFNNSANTVDVGSWTFICIYNETLIPNGTTIPGNGYLIIARTNTTRFKQIYPNTPPDAVILNGGDKLILRNSYDPQEDLVIHLKSVDNSYQDSLTYNLGWDNGAANGTGKTLERKSLFITNVGDSEIDGADDRNWDASEYSKGSPGKVNSVISSPLDVASWIISCQRSTGAICTNQSQTEIIPYKANIAAMGLLEKGGYEGSVKLWIEWCLTHQLGGAIYDYEIDNDEETPLYLTTQAEDSNIGTFFILLKRYCQKTLDVDFLKGEQAQLDLVSMAFYLSCLQDQGVDYLTWTKLDTVEKLLMNNTKSYRGFKDYASLYFDLDFSDSRSERDWYNNLENLIRQGLETELWNNAQEWYYWQKDNSGNKTDCNWATLYPDAVSQIYTILNRVHLPESSSSADLYDTFNTQQPSWTGTNSYCEMGYVAGLMADTTKAQSYQNSITNNVINQGYPSPWDCQEAGFYLLMEARLEELEEIEPLLTKPRELGVNFLTSCMQRAFGGIQAQFDNISDPLQGRGVNHEVTSEATGQAMLYAAGIGDRELFDAQLNVLMDKFLSDTYNLLVWKITPNGDWWQNEWGDYGNAAIDDLRAIRALLLAYDTWGAANYLNYATLLAQGLKEHNTVNDEFRDYFSWRAFGKETSQDVVLSHIDLSTMNRLAQIDTDWENILQTNKQIILGGTTSVGLYYPRYSFGNYNGEEISMIHASWISLSLARYWQETGEVDCRVAAEKFLSFAKNEYQNHNKIFGEYEVISGNPTVSYGDTAIYSIIARLAFILGDFAFAKDLRDNKILNHQNTEKKSQTVGCFGYDYENPSAFVCLESLLALLELEAEEEYFIRGKVTTADMQPIEGVLLTLSGTTLATTTTNSTGEYELKGQSNGSYTITPSKQGYKFEPVQISLLDKHYDHLNFIGIGGKINLVSPVSGTAGTIIIISGEGFDGEEPIRISFGKIITVTMVTSHPLGSFSTIFTAGLLPSGTITIIAYGIHSTVLGYAYFFLRALDHFKIEPIFWQVAGKEFQIVIYPLDAREQLFEYCGTVSLSDDSLSIFPGQTTPFPGGIWTGTVTITKAGLTSITANYQDSAGTSNAFFVTPGLFDHFIIGTITNQTAGVPFTITITAKDQWENTVIGFTESATLTLTPQSSNLTPTLTTNFTAGLWQGTVTITRAGTTAIVASYQDKAGTSNFFVLTPNSFDHFIIGTITNQTAGVPFTITITAKDRWENMVTGFTDIADLTLTPQPSNLIPTTTTNFTDGLWQGTVTITKAGTTAIVASYQDRAGTSNPFFVKPDALCKIVINPPEIKLDIESEYLFEASGFDKYGNELEGLDYTWKTLIGSVEPAVGIRTLFKATTTTTIGTLTATYNTIIGYATISLEAGTLSYIIITPEVATVTVSGCKVFTAKGYDGYGNEEFIDGGEWTIPSWMGSITPWTGTQTIFYAGVQSGYGTINYQLNQIQATATITILPGTHTQFKIGTISSPQGAGIPFNISITAVDSYNNPIENFIGDAKLSYSAGKIYPENLTAFVLGIWSGTITLENASNNASITVQDRNTPNIEGKSNFFNVLPNNFHHFNIGELAPNYLINSRIPLSITAEDTYGNILTDYNATFTLTDDTQTIKPNTGYFTSGRFSGTVSIFRAKPHIGITVTAADRMGTSNPFTTLIDNESGGKVTGDIGDEKTSIEIVKESLPADFYITIDPKPQQQRLEINLANYALSHNKTAKGITNSLHLFQAYDKDDQPMQVGTNSFMTISLPFPDENQDEFVDYTDVRIKEQTLEIYELKDNRWQKVKGSLVHPYENIVSAQVSRLGVYKLIGQIIPANLDTLVVYPNPFKPVRGDTEIIFKGVPSNSTIRIYDLSGSLIKEIENISLGKCSWNVQDAYGRNVASGMYIYIVSSDEGMKKIGKIAIIR